jgi:hypothetical protein
MPVGIGRKFVRKGTVAYKTLRLGAGEDVQSEPVVVLVVVAAAGPGANCREIVR